jgi:cyclase
MAKSRLIPKLQLRSSDCNQSKLVLVITKQFSKVLEIGDPVSQAKIFQDQAADELIFININLTNREEIPLLARVINRVAQEIFMPLTVGGGVDSLDDFKVLLANGADKICLNTAAILDPGLITTAAEKYGSQCVVASIDFKCDNGKDYFVYTHGGRTKTSMHPVECAMQAEKIGAGELLLTSIDHDGTKQGLNVEISKMISEHVSIPIINSGGCGLARHFIDGFLAGHANAIAAGTFFAHRDQNFMQTRSHILNAGVNIRYHR